MEAGSGMVKEMKALAATKNTPIANKRTKTIIFFIAHLA
jgi:hypothetical protein